MTLLNTRSAQPYQHSTMRHTLLAATIACAAVLPAVETPVRLTIDAERPLRALDPAWFGSGAEYYCAAFAEGLKHPAAVQAMKDTGIGHLRWPHGTSALWYFWDAPRQSYSPDWVKHWLTSEDFVAAGAALGTEPLVQVNTYQFRREGFKDFEQSKVLLAPGNIGEGAKYAAKWVATAKDKGWKVRWWEVGNEDWVYWSGRQHASIATTYAKAMREADPSIKVLAQGFCGSWTSELVDNHGPQWTEDLARGLKPGAVDGLSVHCYAGGVIDGRPRPLAEEAAAAFARIGSSCDEVAALRPMLARHGHGAMQLWVTEYNLMAKDAKGPGGLAWWQHLAHGLTMADWTGRLLDLGVDRLAVHDLAGHPVFELVDLVHKGSMKDPRLTAPGLALQAFTGVRLAGLLPVACGDNPPRLSGTYHHPELKQEVTGSYPAVGAWALRRADGGLRLVLVNRDLAAAQPVALAFAGAAPADATPVARLRLGEGLALDATNFGTQRLAWVPATTTWGAVRSEPLPAHSLTVLDLPR